MYSCNAEVGREVMREKKANPAGQVPGFNSSQYAGKHSMRLSCLQSMNFLPENQETRVFLAAVKRLRESLVDLVGAFYFEHLIREVQR